MRWPKTAWDLANLYLASFGADLLADDGPRIVGLSEETTGYVSVEYFLTSGRFEDFVVHEVAHVFHDWKRAHRPSSSGRGACLTPGHQQDFDDPLALHTMQSVPA